MTWRAGQCVAAAAEHRRWVELLTCARCDALVCFERFDARLPPEGEQCAGCRRWFCPACIGPGGLCPECAGTGEPDGAAFPSGGPPPPG